MASLGMLPDEILIKILSFTTDEPDFVLNVIPLLNKHFKLLAKERSLWKVFTVPANWQAKQFNQFLRLDVAEFVETLHTSCNPLPFESFDPVPNVTRLNTCMTNFNDVENIPQVFSKLKHFTIQTDKHVEAQLKQLCEVMPEVNIRILDVTSPIILALPSVNKESFGVASRPVLEWCSQNVVGANDRNSSISVTLDDKDYLCTPQLMHFLQNVGTSVKEVYFKNCISTEMLVKVLHLCPNLRSLKLTDIKKEDEDYEMTVPSLQHLRTLMIHRPGVAGATLLPQSSHVSHWYQSVQVLLKQSPNLTSLKLTNPAEVLMPQESMFQLPSSLITLGCTQTKNYSLARTLFECSMTCDDLIEVHLGGTAVGALADLCELIPNIEPKPWRNLKRLVFMDSHNFNNESACKFFEYLVKVKAPIETLRVHSYDIFASQVMLGWINKFQTLRLLYLRLAFDQCAPTSAVMHIAASLPLLETLSIITRIGYTLPLPSGEDTTLDTPEEIKEMDAQTIMTVVSNLKWLKTLKLRLECFSSIDEIEKMQTMIRDQPHQSQWIHPTKLVCNTAFLHICPAVFRSP